MVMHKRSKRDLLVYQPHAISHISPEYIFSRSRRSINFLCEFKSRINHLSLETGNQFMAAFFFWFQIPPLQGTRSRMIIFHYWSWQSFFQECATPFGHYFSLEMLNFLYGALRGCLKLRWHVVDIEKLQGGQGWSHFITQYLSVNGHTVHQKACN